ncbi:amidohydrolase family protein [Nocardioides sp. CER19]|uniref:amidohydrolase family protein n=1 Tax=Nocardioides sp. CER19 TaxID=3038538 RepID=UPI00244B36B1|nr:amidohydrolase family protein [Nocardioides sp. CER19]MDH2413868.1 amidohydrolase family protein [Nocardioides sp. CER19]
MRAGAIDPASSSPVALRGRVVTLDAAGTVVDDGVVYARDGSLVDVRPAAAAPPVGFETVAVAPTRGTLFPGLIELHNHLPYDVLSLWAVPRRYTNRDQWSGRATPQYHQLISGPMGSLGRQAEVVPAIVRYVEVRALLGGTTTSQGIALASNAGIVSHFRGLVRNVESTGDRDLPPAATHIADIESTDAEHFLARISGTQKLLLHLSEGVDRPAHDHFEALHLTDGRWAITENLIGIHCAALTAEDFQTYAAHGGSMVWSPLSNLLLYGKTADIAAARRAGVAVALGSDWSPSGSKNLLGELKVARIYADTAGILLSDVDLVRMATTNPAQLLGWSTHLGSLEPGKRADLIVLTGRTGDPYRQLITATEADVHLVMINGVARVGTPGLMHHQVVDPGAIVERIRVGGRTRVLNLAQATADAQVDALSVAEAEGRLAAALAELPAAPLAAPALSRRPVPTRGDRAQETEETLLAVADVIDNHMTPRPHLPLHGRLTGPNLPGNRDTELSAAAASLPLPALPLDPLAAVDNPGYYEALGTAINLPEDIRTQLQQLSEQR